MLLASAAALPLLLATAGCRSSDAFTGPDPLAGRPPLGHDVLTLQAVIAAEENLIRRYRTAVEVAPGTAAGPRVLRSLLAQHEQHLAQLSSRRRSARRRRSWCSGCPPCRPPWPSCSRASRPPTPRTRRYWPIRD